MTSIITNAAAAASTTTTTAMHPPPPDQIIPLHSETENQPPGQRKRQITPRQRDDCGENHNEINGHPEIMSSGGDYGDGEEKKDSRQHFYGPTPLHKNSRFFQEKDSGAGERPLHSQPSSQPIRAVNDIDEPPDQTEQPHNVDSQKVKEIPEETASQTPLEKKGQQQTSPSPQKRRRRRRNAVVIEGDASTAFSPYRPVAPLSALLSKGTDDNEVDTTQQNNPKNTKRFKRKERRSKRDHRSDVSIGHNKNNKTGSDSGRPKYGGLEKNTGSSSASSLNSGFASRTKNAQQTNDANKTILRRRPQTSDNDDGKTDPVQSILQSEDDPVLQNYLPQLAFLDDEYYSKVRPYRMGRRDLPPNQIEVILRRRAVRKRADVQKIKGAATGGRGAAAKGSVAGGPPLPPPASAPPSTRRPPPHQNVTSPPRRKLFPVQQQQQSHSPTPSYRKAAYYEDDSTISSAASFSTYGIMPVAVAVQNSVEPATLPLARAVAVPPSSLPREKVVGDTSLGLKLTILHGKVIVQNVAALDDGRASPAQLCGALIEPGDVIVAVDGRSLVRGSVDVPAGMDRIISVLKPLSQPADEGTGEYSREVRLRFVLGEGRRLLAAQRERDRRKAEAAEHRRKLGLEHKGAGGGVTKDPAADLFGIGAFMGVDQHSGMPMFGHLAEEQHHHGKEEVEKKENEKEEKVSPKGAVLDEGEGEKNHKKSIKKKSSKKSFTDRTTARRSISTIQAEIAHQVQLDLQFTRNRNASGFFAMNQKAPKILRPPSPPPQASGSVGDLQNPAEVRKRRLELGARTMKGAESIVSVVERQDRGLDRDFEDEDPMEVASRACGTSTVASVRTGASRRRWHRGLVPDGGGGAIAEESASRVSSVESRRPNFADFSTIRSGRSGESGIDEEAIDHRQLVELAANNVSWKRNVRRRLEAYSVEDVDLEEEGVVPPPSATTGATGIDSLLFGGDVASILNKKKQSLALPPGEITSMLYDLFEQLSEGDGGVLPQQIFTNVGEGFQPSAPLPLFSPEKVVSFSRDHREMNVDVERATEFLIDEDGGGALGAWLRSFRPLPWKQRRALWPASSSGTLDGGGDYSTIMSSRMMDDNESISMMSGTIATQRSMMDSAVKDKRNLRELIEDLELDHETRRETCQLVTFYFMQKFSHTQLRKNKSTITKASEKQPLESMEEEDKVAAFIDSYGSYLDIYKCLVFAGKCRSKRMVDKLVGAAKFDPQHKEAVRALQKAKVLLFYERSMLSALLELLPSISARQCSGNLNFVALLVSAYPDLQPWCVQEAATSSSSDDAENSGRFYMEYLSSLLHHEDGNDAAKRDEALVKEWCSMLCSPDGSAASDPAFSETYRQSFFRVASREDSGSLLYHRDLPFLMDISVQISEFGLALNLANEIISTPRYCRDKQVLLYVLEHLSVISDKAIKGNEGEINTILLAQVVSFFNVISPRVREHDCEFDSVAELSKLLEKCRIEIRNSPQYSPSNMAACITTLSENAPPAQSLQVLSQWENGNGKTAAAFGSSSSISLALTSALHTSLIRGAREGVLSELSGSLLRIQRAREEGSRPVVVENDGGMMMGSGYWNACEEEEPQLGGDGGCGGEEEASGDFLWTSVVEGTLVIAK